MKSTWVFACCDASGAATLGEAVAFLCERLGATFIKVAQIVSTRPDLFAPDFLAPIARLQDNVAPVAFAAIRKVVEADLGRPLEEVFAEFGRVPVASASVAQVHRASLRHPRPGEPRALAVKVLRPGVERRVDLDEAILRTAARLARWIPALAPLSPREAMDEFCGAVHRQLDFKIEAANNLRFRENFAADGYLVFPRLVERLCTKRVLVMEFLEGVRVEDLDRIHGEPALHARQGIQAVCRMIYEHGFVHADMHPGNLLYLRGNRLALLDLGLVAELDLAGRRRIALVNYFMALGMGRELARLLREDSLDLGHVDAAAFEADVVAYAAKIARRPLEELQVTLLIGELFDVIRRHHLRARPEFTVVGLAVIAAEGLGRRLDPSVSPAFEAQPFLEAAVWRATATNSSIAPPRLE